LEGAATKEEGSLALLRVRSWKQYKLHVKLHSNGRDVSGLSGARVTSIVDDVRAPMLFEKLFPCLNISSVGKAHRLIHGRCRLLCWLALWRLLNVNWHADRVIDAGGCGCSIWSSACCIL
jgi:hypothetical protein